MSAMIRRFAPALLALVLLAPTARAKTAAPVRAVLPNGLTVVLQSSPRLPVVNFRLVARAGSVYDPAGQEGLARQTAEGRLHGHVHLGLRLVEERAGALDAAARTELLHAIASHHDRQHARTAEAAVLYHANQLDAVAATRPVGED